MRGFRCQSDVQAYSALMEASLDDGEIVVQPRRSAKVMNMNQEFIHETSLAFGHGCQMGDASIQIPHGASFVEDFKDAVAEDQQARTGRNVARLSREIDTRKHAHDQTGGRKTERIRLARKQEDGGGMTAAGPSHGAARAVVNTIPDREEFFAMVFALEDVIQFGQHLIGLLHVGPGQCARADHVGHGDGKQRGIEPVSGDVDEVEGEVILVHPVVTDRIAAEGGGREVAPINRDQPVASAAGCSRAHI